MSEHRKRLEEALHSSVLDGLPDITGRDAELAAVEIDGLISYTAAYEENERLKQANQQLSGILNIELDIQEALQAKHSAVCEALEKLIGIAGVGVSPENYEYITGAVYEARAALGEQKPPSPKSIPPSAERGHGSGPLPGRDVTAVQTGEKTLFVTRPFRPRCKGKCGDMDCEQAESDWQAGGSVGEQKEAKR